jgi:hypothetical protein
MRALENAMRGLYLATDYQKAMWAAGMTPRWPLEYTSKFVVVYLLATCDSSQWSERRTQVVYEAIFHGLLFALLLWRIRPDLAQRLSALTHLGEPSESRQVPQVAQKSSISLVSLDIDGMIRSSSEFLAGQNIPSDRRFWAVTLRGVIAGLYTGMEHPTSQQELASHAIRTSRSCGAMAGEAKQIVCELTGSAAQEIEQTEDPLGLIANAICDHRSLVHLSHLFKLKPLEATKYALAVGMNVAFLLWKEQPSLANAICRRQAQGLQAETQTSTQLNRTSAPSSDAKRYFDRDARKIVHMFCREDRPLVERAKDTMCGGLIYGLSVARSNGPRSAFFSSDASDDPNHADNIAGTRELARFWSMPAVQESIFAAGAGDAQASERTIAMLWRLFEEGADASGVRNGSMSLAYEAGCRSLAFAIVLWEDHPALATKLSMTIPVLREELVRGEE